MSIYTHKHHIIPKHAGGTDDPSNLIELSVEEHAQAHKELWEIHGKWEDYVAWLGLSGQIGKQEAIRLAQSFGAKELAERRRKDKSHPWLGSNNPSRKKVNMGNHHLQHNIGNRPGDLIQYKLVSEGKHHWQTDKHKENTSKNTRKRISASIFFVFI